MSRFVFIALCLTLQVTADELVYAIFAARHGVKIPPTKNDCLKDIDPWSKDSADELTPIGFQQFNLLGEQSRRRYVDSIKLLNEEYNPE